MWAICYCIPPVEFMIGLLLAVGFKTRFASIAGNIMFVVMMFGTVAQRNFATAHIMWWYVLIFAALGGLSFADRYSLDRVRKEGPFWTPDSSLRRGLTLFFLQEQYKAL